MFPWTMLNLYVPQERTPMSPEYVFSLSLEAYTIFVFYDFLLPCVCILCVGLHPIAFSFNEFFTYDLPHAFIFYFLS